MSKSPLVAEQFEELEQQHGADLFGMWIFLATEVMFFGGLFLCYTVYRSMAPAVFAHASHHLSLLLGGINTGVLLCSSLSMALAVRSIQLGQRAATVGLLLLTGFLGLVFLGIKGWEYHDKFVEHLVPGSHFQYDGAEAARAQMFFWLYFAMTGLHGLHVLIGVAVLSTIAVLVGRGRVNQERYMAVEVTGLYWHFVDIVWVFLYPLLYLAGGSRMTVPIRTYVKVWAALLVLLLITIGAAFLDLGPINFPFAMLIASIKAFLIARIFMHIRGSPPLLHLAAGAGLLWLAIMLALTMNDYFTREAAVWLTGNR